MFNAPALEIIAVVILLIIAIEIGLILVILLQTAIESRRMNDSNMFELQEFRRTAAQEAILRDHLEKEHFATVLKDVLDKGGS